VRGEGGFRILSRMLAEEFLRSAGSGDAIVNKNTANARICLIFCFLAGVFVVSGCGSRPSPKSGQREEQPRVSIDSRGSSTGYNLGRDEERGGHTLARHVARTDDELRGRLAQERNISAASTWSDRETAESVVAEALAAERRRVDGWTRRGFPRANLALHYNAGRVIGRSLLRGDSQAVDCSAAVIVLRADGPESFYVLTTYPEARE
jgi:hypothetical protein